MFPQAFESGEKQVGEDNMSKKQTTSMTTINNKSTQY